MPIATQAAVVRPGTPEFRWEDVTLDDPRPDEVLVRMVATSLCHTDLSVRDGKLGVPLPAVLGHEGAGVVEAVGDAVRGVRPGDAVVLSFASCGSCPACRRGRPAYCRAFLPRNFGLTRQDGTSPVTAADGTPIGARFFGQSSLARHAVVDARCVVPVDADGEDDLAGLAPLGCGVQTGAGAVLTTLRPGPGDTVAVFGAGAVGLSAVMAARLTGAARVVAVDIAPDRLALARDLGATDTVDARAEDPVAALAGRVTHAVEASGVPTVLRQAVESLAAGGTVAVVGLPPLGTEVALDVNHLLHGRTVTGVVEGDADPATFVPALLALHRAGRLPFDRLVTRYAPEDVERAAADAAAGRVVKPLLRYH